MLSDGQYETFQFEFAVVILIFAKVLILSNGKHMHRKETLIKIIPLLDKRQAKVIVGLLRANGFKRNRERIVGLIIKHLHLDKPPNRRKPAAIIKYPGQ